MVESGIPSNGMFVIGIDKWNFMDIKTKTEITSTDINFIVTIVTYGLVDYGKASIFTSYDRAESILNQIKNRKDEIQFINDNIVGQMLDEENNYKLNVDDLKIFKLVPTLVNNE